MKTALQIWNENPPLQAALKQFTDYAGVQFVAALADLNRPVLSVMPGQEGTFQDARMHQNSVGYAACLANIERLLPEVIGETVKKQAELKQIASARPYDYAKP